MIRTLTWRWAVVLAVTAAGIPRGALAGTPQEPGFTETVYVQSAQLAEPTRILFAPDGSNRLFVVRKGGQVRIIKNGALLPTPFATVNPIEPNFEGGLLGIAFDQDYATNRYVYLFGGVTLSEQQVIRYTDVNDVGQDKTIILRNLPTVGANHVGGGFAIGPDNHLYWGIGDLGNLTGVNADLSSLASKIGRAQLDGGVPNDNPFNDGAGPNNDYIFARGFRNPYGLAFQPATGQLWVTSCGNGYEQVWMIDAADHAGWNAYENTQPTGFRAPVIAYRTGYFDSRQIANAGPTRSNNEATYPLMPSASTPPFRPGHRVTVRDVVDPSFNGDFYVKEMTGANTLVLYQPGPDATSAVTNGFRYITTQELGGCVVGGGFYQSTAFPAAYRGNFYFADFVGNNVIRATPGASNRLERVDRFVTGVSSVVDVTSGPDGALYYAAYGPSSGTIYRLARTVSAQGIVVSRTAVDVSEGGLTEVSVSLAQAPSANVVVTVARTGGDPDVAVTIGASLTFTPTNWSVPQPVRIEAAPSAVAGTREATVTASAPSVAPEAITVRVRRTAAQGFVVSTASLTVDEGQGATFTVALARAPAADVTATVARTSGSNTISVSGGASLTFTPARWSTPQVVTVATAVDPGPADNVATLTISAPQVQSRSVTVTARSTSSAAPMFTSSPPLTAAVGAPYRYTLTASGVPAPSFSLVTAPAGMTLTGAVVSWTPAAVGTFDVSVTASNGVQPDARQDFRVVVSTDAAPVAELTAPAQGEVVSGANAEFYGDCIDDVGCVRAEFYVDGALGYTDTTAQTDPLRGHFHFGGQHFRWDTTVLSDGPHTLRLEVVDTAGQRGAVERTVTVLNGDAGTAPVDAGTSSDAGTDAGPVSGRCGCTAAPSSLLLVAAVMLLRGARARRQRQG